MQEIIQMIGKKIAPVKRELVFCLVCTFLWGLAAHGYRYFNNSITHDSINEFLGTAQIIKVKFQAGRFMVPVLYGLRGNVSSGWWLGMLSLTYIGLASFLLCRVLQVKEGWAMFLITGILTANQSYTAMAATYLHDLDCNCLALLLSVLAAYLWKRRKWGWLLGAVPVALSLGLYQSFLSVTICLVLFSCILDLIRNQKVQQVFPVGLRAVGMLILGGLLYICLLKIAAAFSGTAVSSDGYNSLSNMAQFDWKNLLPRIVDAWKKSVTYFVKVNSSYPFLVSAGIQGLVLGIPLLAVVGKLLDSSCGWQENGLLLALTGLIPLGMNVARVLSGGMSHDLMMYAIWLFYVFALLVTLPAQGWKKTASQLTVTVLIGAMLFSNLQVSNTVYIGKQMVKEAGMSLFTRILYSMEQTEGYETGKTPVAFVGKPETLLTDLPEELDRYTITGYNNPYAIGALAQTHYESYFRYQLLNPTDVLWQGYALDLGRTPEVMEMPCYPAEGSVKMVGDTLVVKLGEIPEDE